MLGRKIASTRNQHQKEDASFPLGAYKRVKINFPPPESAMNDFHSLQHCQSCRMQEHLLMHQLTPELRKELNAICFRITLPAGSTIFHEGDEPTGVLILRKGRAKVTMSSEEGRTVILYLALSWGVVGAQLRHLRHRPPGNRDGPRAMRARHGSPRGVHGFPEPA